MVHTTPLIPNRRRLIVSVGAMTVLTSLLAVAAVDAPASAATVPVSKNLVANGGFESGLKGWRTNKRVQVLRKSNAGRGGGQAARLTVKRKSGAVLNDKRNSARTTVAKERYELTAWVRTNRPKVNGQVRIRAVKKGKVQRLASSFRLTNTQWTKVTVQGAVRRAGSTLDVNVIAWKLPRGTKVFIDEVSLRKVKLTSARKAPAPTEPPAGKLTNGCTYTSRGIPSCGAYVGGAHKSNTDPKDWEGQLGKQLGVRRTYYSAAQVDGAVAKAKDDVAHRRIPWISFKAPHSWGDMAAGKGDVWARGLASKLAKIDGPVWVAIHHEPENDGGDIAAWTAMQARLAPIFRSAGSNIAFSIILMGYHQFYGASEHRLANIWPKNTKVDIAGFDIYDEYGMTKNGQVVKKHKQFRANYFDKIQAWAEPRGVAWGLAETGFSKASVANTPTIMTKTYNELVDTGGIAFSYFDSPLNSTIDWTLSDPLRRTAFRKVHAASPTWR